MKSRVVTGCFALMLVMPLGLNVSAAQDCANGGCAAPAKTKPLDIMKFMREQAASTRVAKPEQAGSHSTAKVRRAAPRDVAKRSKPAPIPAEAAASFASRPAQADWPKVQAPVSPFLPATDSAAEAASAETTGQAIAPDPRVQLVDASEFNDIDRKAPNRSSYPTTTGQGDNAPTHREQANSTWLQWIWSALASTLSALTAALHQLIGLKQAG